VTFVACAALLAVAWPRAVQPRHLQAIADAIPAAELRVAAPSSVAKRAVHSRRRELGVTTIRAALENCAPRMSESERSRLAEVVLRESSRHGYDPMFVQALIEVESMCRPTVRSRAGAVGLVQVMPATARAVARRYGMDWSGPDGLNDPALNVRVGLRYLADLEERFDDPILAVAAYNLGPTRVARMAPARARDSRYVRKVIRRYEGLLNRHAPVAL